jgi:hypothetical protein
MVTLPLHPNSCLLHSALNQLLQDVILQMSSDATDPWDWAHLLHAGVCRSAAHEGIVQLVSSGTLQAFVNP